MDFLTLSKSSYFINFSIMENVISPQVQYTLNEKYFQIEPENRIRRYQYFVRSIVPGILMALAMMI